MLASLRSQTSTWLGCICKKIHIGIQRSSTRKNRKDPLDWSSTVSHLHIPHRWHYWLILNPKHHQMLRYCLLSHQSEMWHSVNNQMNANQQRFKQHYDTRAQEQTPFSLVTSFIYTIHWWRHPAQTWLPWKRTPSFCSMPLDLIASFRRPLRP